MLNSPRLSCVRTVLLCLLAVTAAATAHGQATPPQSTLDRVLSRMDFGVSGVGQFTGTVSGTNYLGVNVSQSASNTLGALVTVRYTKSPYKGFEFNYSYARYTENFSAYLAGGAQTNATEYTLGYVAHPPHQVLGFNPFLSGGLGLIEFEAHRLRRPRSSEPGRPWLLLRRRPREVRHQSPLRRPRSGPSGLLPRPRLLPELPHHRAEHLHLRTRLRLLPQVLSQIPHPASSRRRCFTIAAAAFVLARPRGLTQP